MKEAILAGCEKGLKDKLTDANWKISKEQPAEIKNRSSFLINKFVLGKNIIWELHADFSSEDYPPQLFIEAFGGDIIKTIIFQNKNNEYFDLRQLAPKNSYFIKEKSFNCKSEKIQGGYEHIIVYNKKSLVDNGGFLSFLHEIGHAYINEKMNMLTSDKIVKLTMDARFLSKGELIDKYSDKERTILLQNERNVWVWAIKTMRELRRQGIDLIPGLGKEEIKKWIYDETRLSSYMRELDISSGILRNIRKEKLKFFDNESR